MPRSATSGIAVGTLAGSLEVKRVFVAPPVRGTGVSRLLMGELERIAADRGAERLILQTGDRQPDAIALYEKIGYTPHPGLPAVRRDHVLALLREARPRVTGSD